MRRKITIGIAIILCVSLLLVSCVPSKYRNSLEVDTAYPDEVFAIYDPAVVFEFEQTGDDFRLRAGTEEGMDAVVRSMKICWRMRWSPAGLTKREFRILKAFTNSISSTYR
jgi:hypothetical protein